MIKVFTGLELLEQVSDLDAIIIPVGGGGLIAGMSVAIKTLYPNIQIIGVESETCLGFTVSFGTVFSTNLQIISINN